MTATDTADRILDAALDVIGRQGIARTSLEDVAVAAGVSRQTVYRHVGSRQGLLTRLVVREEARLLAHLRQVVAGHEALRPALEAAIGETLVWARGHALFGRLLETEPAAMLPVLLDGRGPVLPAARSVVAELFARWTPHLASTAREQAAEACARLVLSYVVTPDAPVPEAVAADLAALLSGGVAGLEREAGGEQQPSTGD